jgi:hypothetical protein
VADVQDRQQGGWVCGNAAGVSTVRLGSQSLLAASNLEDRRQPARAMILEMVDRLLWEMGRKPTVGEEILWGSLHLTVEPHHGGVEGLRFRADVEMHRDDWVAMLNAVAIAEHERGKS